MQGNRNKTIKFSLLKVNTHALDHKLIIMPYAFVSHIIDHSWSVEGASLNCWLQI